MHVNEYLKDLVQEQLGGDRSRFDDLWDLVPDLASRLRSFDSDRAWLHWSPKTFDGWYCVQVQGGYDVYTQDRGVKGDFVHFLDERQAIKFAIDASVFPLAQANNSFKPKPLRGSA